IPTRQAFMSELVGREDLMNAISLNSSMVQASRVLGPSIDGILVSLVGEGACFVINGVSFLAVIGGLLTLKPNAVPRSGQSVSALVELKEGFEYVATTRPIRAVLLLVASVSVFGLSYLVLLPEFAARVLGGGPAALGLLTASAGTGALAGALFLATRLHPGGLGKLVARSVVGFGVMMIAFAVSRTLVMSMALLATAGFALMVQMSASNTLIQTIVPDRLRGRLMSFYSMSLMGMTPFGNLLAGGLGARIGAPGTVVVGGALCLVAATVFWMRLNSLSRDEAWLLAVSSDRPVDPKALEPTG